jgi:isocitrate/isopropylmalate dehydrogenase
MTPSKRAKQLGAKSLKQVADNFGCTVDNLNAKFKSKPHQFDIIVIGVVNLVGAVNHDL